MEVSRLRSKYLYRPWSRQLVLSEREEIISAGNFHGEYPAKACDYLAIGIHEIASMSERRIERLVNPGQCVCSASAAPAVLFLFIMFMALNQSFLYIIMMIIIIIFIIMILMMMMVI